jgi:hypothetical protein
VLRKDVLAAALDAVAENGGAPGVDGESLRTITATPESREQWLETLRGELQAKTYRPSEEEEGNREAGGWASRRCVASGSPKAAGVGNAHWGYLQ